MTKQENEFGDIRGTKKLVCEECEQELSHLGYFSLGQYLKVRGLR